MSVKIQQWLSSEVPVLLWLDRLDGKAAHVTSPGAIPAHALAKGAASSSRKCGPRVSPSGLGVGGGDECDTDLPLLGLQCGAGD